jgi:16S rRNA (cytidine1402-2'-O)-methyltransferase
LLYGLENE